MRNRFATTLAVALGATVSLAGAADANPLSFFYSLDGSSYTQFGTTVDASNSATVVLTGVTISAVAVAPPALPMPGLQTSFVGITASGAGTYYVAVIESGVSTPTYSGFGINFGNGATSTVNALDAATTIVNGTSNVLGYASLTPGDFVVTLASAGGLPASYSLGELFVGTFGARGGTLNASVSIFGVPEPMSAALLGAGLLGVAAMRPRKDQRQL